MFEPEDRGVELTSRRWFYAYQADDGVRRKDGCGPVPCDLADPTVGAWQAAAPGRVSAWIRHTVAQLRALL